MIRKILLAALLGVAVLLIYIGSANAYMRKQTEVVSNTLEPGVVKCAVNEAFDGTTKSKITVTNTGNVAAYIRLRLVTYWEDPVDGIIFGNPPALNIVLNSKDWFQIGDIYYYKYPVEPYIDENSVVETTNLLNVPEVVTAGAYGGIVLGKETGGDNYQVVEVFAEAIQSLPAGAVTTSWGVTVDSNGIITGP